MFKKFVSYYKPYKGSIIIDLFCALLVAGIDLVFPMLLKEITTNLVPGGNEVLKTIITASGILLGLYGIRFFCNYYMSAWGHICGVKMEADMRRDLFTHYMALPFSYYDKNSTGEMQSKLLADLFDVTELAHHGPEDILISVIKIIGSVILLSVINWQITLILLAVVIVMAICALIANRRMFATFRENRIKTGEINKQVQDSLLGIKVIKSFASEGEERRKFDLTNDAFIVTKSDSYHKMGSFHAVNSLFQGALYIAALLAGGIFFTATDPKIRITAIEFAMYFLYIGIFIAPVQTLINFTEQFQKGHSGFKRLLDLLGEDAETLNSDALLPLNITNGEIEFRNVSFSYNEKEEVLDGVSFKAEGNHVIALVGQSGGGKTTIASLIPRFYKPHEGQILIDGQDIQKVSAESLRTQIGVVQQDVYIFNGTMYENIAYGRPGATREDVEDAAKRANIHEFIMSLPEGYQTKTGERGARLSGGQKQRISIARVFLKNPKILILDEATSALDNVSERKIQEALNELSKSRTTIAIAHRLSTIRRADRILVIEGGKIAEEGSHKELLEKDGIYAEYSRLSE
ncbi:MAG: ABC transporter ATP-binding protein/permease [Christensenellaceae bacterium]|jgi:ATP-binding cassette subfamily B protein|nr:ABC transporter ATP-binding protein/permease [Christensenellaceae bacterium]